MRIGKLAHETGVSTDTLRFYEREGLVRADRRANGYRDFPEDTVGLVRLIRLAQGLGFSLAEIGALLRGLGDGLEAEEVATLLQGKLEEIDARIAAMQELREVIAARLTQPCPLRM